MKNKFLFVGMIAFSVIMSACGSAVKVNFPTGKFVKSGETNYGMEFKPDGTFSTFRGDVIYVTGTYKVNGNVFTETSNDGGCNTNVSFNYTFDGTNLTFSYVDDPKDDTGCSGRNADFNNVTYLLSK